jgi:hypothetical protein
MLATIGKGICGLLASAWSYLTAADAAGRSLAIWLGVVVAALTIVNLSLEFRRRWRERNK